MRLRASNEESVCPSVRRSVGQLQSMKMCVQDIPAQSGFKIKGSKISANLVK